MAYITINRKLFNHFFWNENRVYSRFEAWIDLIQLVSFQENNEKLINGVLVKWHRGQTPVSYSFLSQRWNWSIHKVRTFIMLLKTEKQVATLTTNVTTILTLCNYNTYNPISQADIQADVQAEGKRTAGSKINKEGKINKEIEDIVAFYNSTQFPKISKLTPARLKHLNARIKEHGTEGVIEIIKRANNSSFLLGQNDRQWKAGFDFLMNPEKFIRIMEGKYDNKKTEQKPMMP